MAKAVDITWLSVPEDHDYPAAESYLCLLYDEATAKQQVEQWRQAPVSTFKAKDIFRASGLSLLGISHAHVAKDQEFCRGFSLLQKQQVAADKTP